MRWAAKFFCWTLPYTKLWKSWTCGQLCRHGICSCNPRHKPKAITRDGDNIFTAYRWNCNKTHKIRQFWNPCFPNKISWASSLPKHCVMRTSNKNSKAGKLKGAGVIKDWAGYIKHWPAWLGHQLTGRKYRWLLFPRKTENYSENLKKLSVRQNHLRLSHAITRSYFPPHHSMLLQG